METSPQNHESKIDRRILVRIRSSSQLKLLTLILVFILVFVAFSISAPYFLTITNITNLMSQMAPVLIVAIPMTLVITSGGIDLSVGSMLALSGSVLSLLIAAGWPWWASTLAVLGISVVIGLATGYFIANQGVAPFIVTLASLSILEGMALYLTKGYTISIPSSPLTVIGQGFSAGIPNSAFLALLAAFAGFIILNHTPLGTHITASGANERALARLGVNVSRVKYVVYILSALSGAIAGIIYAGELSAGSADIGAGFELTVIAGVILGGTDLFGGSGTIVGTVIGVALIEMVKDALILLHVPPSLTEVAQGLILLLAIVLNLRISGLQKYFQKSRK